MNDVFILPSQYILNRWTKYAKRGFYIEKQGTDTENLKTQAARISRKATSVALKCSTVKELLDDLEKAIDKLDLEADNSLSKMKEKSNEVSLVSIDCAAKTFKGVVSFRVPLVVKGADDQSSLSKRIKERTRKMLKRKVLIYYTQSSKVIIHYMLLYLILYFFSFHV